MVGFYGSMVNPMNEEVGAPAEHEVVTYRIRSGEVMVDNLLPFPFHTLSHYSPIICVAYPAGEALLHQGLAAQSAHPPQQPPPQTHPRHRLPELRLERHRGHHSPLR